MQTEANLPADIFHINTGSSDPIYRQLVEQLRRLVAGGQVRAQDGMPSVREVASTLGVNPMTVSKAYSLLEAEGVLERRRGMGMIVAQRPAELSHSDARLEMLKPALARIAQEARQLELEPAQVIALLSKIFKEKG